jgi:hypothetical protein
VKAAQIADKPIDFVEKLALSTHHTKIGLDWNPPVFDGGQTIIDY